MKLQNLFFLPLLAGALGLSLPARAAENVIYKKAVDSSGHYCHLKFPAIQKNTLYSGRPVLKDITEGDIIDFYGPCDYDPLGKEEVMSQRAELVRERNRLVDGR
jgi:hypothetical protein